MAEDGQDWGLARWVKPLLHIVASGTNKLIDLELEHFLGTERYFRFQAQLPEECELDDATPKTFQSLRNLGEDLVTKSSDDLDKVFARCSTRPALDAGQISAVSARQRRPASV